MESKSIRKGLIALALASILPLPTYGAQPDWQQVMDIQQPIEGTTYTVKAKSYIDAANISEQNGIREVTHRLVRDQAIMAPGRLLIKEYRESLQINCSAKSMALVRVAYVDPKGNEVKHRDFASQSLRYDIPPPGSQKATLISAACQAKANTKQSPGGNTSKAH